MNQAGGPLISTRGKEPKHRRKIFQMASAGSLTKLERGVYVDSQTLPYRELADYGMCIAAAAVARPQCLVVGRSAAWVYGLAEVTRWRRKKEREEVELGHTESPRQERTEVAGRAVMHRMVSTDVVRRSRALSWGYGEIKVCGVAEACAQLARWHGIEQAVVAAEDALHRGLINMDEVKGAFARRAHGAPRAKEALNLITRWSESPRESELKVLMKLAGLRAPYQQVSIFRADGKFLGRVDFMFANGVVVEYDGESKHREADLDYAGDYQGEESIRAERQRERLILNEGFTVVRVDKSSFRDGSWVRALKLRLAQWDERPVDLSDVRVSARGKAWKVRGDEGFLRR